MMARTPHTFAPSLHALALELSRDQDGTRHQSVLEVVSALKQESSSKLPLGNRHLMIQGDLVSGHGRTLDVSPPTLSDLISPTEPPPLSPRFAPNHGSGGRPPSLPIPRIRALSGCRETVERGSNGSLTTCLTGWRDSVNPFPRGELPSRPKASD